MKHRVFPTPQSLLLGDASVELTLSWCSDMSLWRTDPVANHLNVFVFYIKKNKREAMVQSRPSWCSTCRGSLRTQVLSRETMWTSWLGWAIRIISVLRK